MTIVTVKALEDCALDAQTFDEAANGAAGVQVKSRLGRTFYTLATYDKKFADRAALFDQMYINYDSTLNTKAKAFDDSLIIKKNEFDTSRNAQVKKYDDTLVIKVKAFDDSLVQKNKEFDNSRNAQVVKYDQTLGAKVAEYDVKINNVDVDLRNATTTANAAKTTADAAKTSADNATTAVGSKLNKTDLKDASTGTKGIAAFATQAEANAGIITNKTLTPSVLPGAIKNQLNAEGEAPTFPLRAWVNFNGIGTVTINAGGNVSGITRNGTGDYTINFIKPMQHADYVVLGINAEYSNGVPIIIATRTTTTGFPLLKTTQAVRISTRAAGESIFDIRNISIGIVC